ncbi:hypothetical protein [Sphingomonas sanxanigenens]|uniref:Uncharacterized protein n=1 Tax=Sphingomonas sanxanigenens DSM 19645 = NX02 TaxID=1123269 RepID=W0AAH0_9SPHN|nr:hypothetical protein [Sphingomonas sanxanigenens]AHE52660.1 hypothetical protein NX02_04585 [Sphingomonas sanxanigenens DSM 19645 = NX02]
MNGGNTVTPKDRQAAAECAVYFEKDFTSGEILGGRADDSLLVEILARHREEARIAALREAEQAALDIAAKLEGDYLHSRSVAVANQKIAANRVAAVIHVLWNKGAQKRRAAFREAFPHLCSGENQ